MRGADSSICGLHASTQRHGPPRKTRVHPLRRHAVRIAIRYLELPRMGHVPGDSLGTPQLLGLIQEQQQRRAAHRHQ
jgi:hypothetical protein